MRFLAKVRKAVVATILALTFGSSAGAFGTADVEKVVVVLEQLGRDLGELAYDEESAAAWFEEDGYGVGRIPTAGFTEKSWLEQADRTMKGYFATLPQAELDSLFARFEAVETRTDIPDDQKAAIREIYADGKAAIGRWRAEGAADAAAVQPYAPRIRALLADQELPE